MDFVSRKGFKRFFLDFVDESGRSTAGRDQVKRSAGDYPLEVQEPDGDIVGAVKIVQQPAVDSLPGQFALYLINARVVQYSPVFLFISARYADFSG